MHVRAVLLTDHLAGPRCPLLAAQVRGGGQSRCAEVPAGEGIGVPPRGCGSQAPDAANTPGATERQALGPHFPLCPPPLDGARRGHPRNPRRTRRVPLASSRISRPVGSWGRPGPPLWTRQPAPASFLGLLFPAPSALSLPGSPTARAPWCLLTPELCPPRPGPAGLPPPCSWSPGPPALQSAGRIVPPRGSGRIQAPTPWTLPCSVGSIGSFHRPPSGSRAHGPQRGQASRSRAGPFPPGTSVVCGQ